MPYFGQSGSMAVRSINYTPKHLQKENLKKCNETLRKVLLNHPMKELGFHSLKCTEKMSLVIEGIFKILF